MPTFERRVGASGKSTWRVRVRRQSGPWLTKSFARKADAEEWARSIEHKLDFGTTFHRAKRESTRSPKRSIATSKSSCKSTSGRTRACSRSASASSMARKESRCQRSKFAESKGRERFPPIVQLALASALARASCGVAMDRLSTWTGAECASSIRRTQARAVPLAPIPSVLTISGPLMETCKLRAKRPGARAQVSVDRPGKARDALTTRWLQR